MDEETRLTDIERVFDFFSQAGKLKKTLRYKEHDSALSESSADHSWRLAVMSHLLSRELKLNIDRDKAVGMALIHDIAESMVGDVSRMVRNGNPGLLDLGWANLCDAKNAETPGRPGPNHRLLFRSALTERSNLARWPRDHVAAFRPSLVGRRKPFHNGRLGLRAILGFGPVVSHVIQLPGSAVPGHKLPDPIADRSVALVFPEQRLGAGPGAPVLEVVEETDALGRRG